jgi:hypothetical protein
MSKKEEFEPFSKRGQGRGQEHPFIKGCIRGKGQIQTSLRKPTTSKTMLVNSHSDDIIDLINKGHGCSEIASAICSLYRYPDKSITGHQVSDLIGYQHKMGYLATPSVTGDKINANWSVNCT